MAEGISLTNAVKPKIQEYYKQHGRFPANNQDAGLPQAQYLIGNYVKGIEVVAGAIHVTYGNKVNALVTDKVLTMRPQFVRQSAITPLAWLCGGDQVVNGMEVAGENLTDLGPQFLPAVCR
ncbi:MAG: pilin [Kangiellaceae bacterium]|nr:pilin [Kangiellaceae bacterium]MCW9016816.1 pilin [Kangiellaceae bacterium]